MDESEFEGVVLGGGDRHHQHQQQRMDGEGEGEGEGPFADRHAVRYA